MFPKCVSINSLCKIYLYVTMKWNQLNCRMSNRCLSNSQSINCWYPERGIIVYLYPCNEMKIFPQFHNTNDTLTFPAPTQVCFGQLFTVRTNSIFMDVSSWIIHNFWTLHAETPATLNPPAITDLSAFERAEIIAKNSYLSWSRTFYYIQVDSIAAFLNRGKWIKCYPLTKCEGLPLPCAIFGLGTEKAPPSQSNINYFVNSIVDFIEFCEIKIKQMVD